MGSAVDVTCLQKSAKLLLRTSFALFTLFWLLVISGKLRLSYFSSIPAINELFLWLLLELSIVLALGACLIKEKQQAPLD